MDTGSRLTGLVIARSPSGGLGLDGARAEAFAWGILATCVASACEGPTIAVADRVPYAVGYPKAEVISTGRSIAGAMQTRRVLRRRHAPFRGARPASPVGPRVQHAELATGNAIVINETLARACGPDSRRGAT